MIDTIVAALAAEKSLGTEHAEQLIARLDSHIRDLETLKAWVRDSAKLRAEALDSLIGGEPSKPAEMPVAAETMDAAA